MLNLLKTYQKRLTNLSSRNKSLLLLRTSKNYFFDFSELNFSVKKSAYELLDAVLFKKTTTSIAPLLDPRDEKATEVSKSLLQLHRSDRLIQAERGAKDLQIGFPIVKGKFSNGTEVRCPLLFFPVVLEREDKAWKLRIHSEPQFNTSFLLAYEQFNDVKLDENLFEEDFSEVSGGLDEFILYLYNYLKDSDLELNFNRELFEKRIENFEHYKKEDLELLANGELKLYPQAILGIFPQSGSFLAQDYTELINKSPHLNLEERFLSKHSDVVKERTLHLPLAVDASQEHVIKKVHEGTSMVVQGPPGSGKSQLIANLMADYAAKGRKVLLVCQKKAALDTVYKRLSEVGLADFVGFVSDFKSDRKLLFQQIAQQVDAVESYKSENLKLDAIFLEREFKTISIEIEKLCEELASFKTALFDETLVGTSAKSIYLQLSRSDLRTASSVTLPNGFGVYDYSSLLSFLSKASKYIDYQQVLQGVPKALWDKRKNTQLWRAGDFKKLRSLLKGVAEERGRFQNWEIVDLGKLNTAISLQRRVENFLNSKSLAKDFFKPTPQKELIGLEQILDSYATNEDRLNGLQEADSEALTKALQATIRASKSSVKFSWFKWTSADWRLLKPWLHEENIIEFEKILQELTLLKQAQSQYLFQSLSEGQSAFKRLKEKNNLIEALSQLGVNSKGEYEDFIDTIQARNAFQNELEQYFTSFDLSTFYNIGFREVLAYLNKNEDNFQALDGLIASLSKPEQKLLGKTQDLATIERSILESLIDKIESQHPILKSVSSLRMEQMEKDLQRLILKKRELSKTNLLIQLKERTYRFVDKNRLGNTTTYRELKHQVSKQRRIWPIRKVLEQFHDDLFKLVPCWMASPETVAAIFPMEQYFDLVIFDEASQCYAEHGLPSMLRGKQVLVAGDDMQLQPSDLYNIRYEATDEEDYLTEIDSLLKLSKTFLPNQMLQGHYRSKTLPLIAFSNSQFYNGKLQLIPDLEEANKNEAPILFENVRGLWHQNQNEIEAKRVSEIVTEIRTSQPTKSIGIVTFNYPQAKLIRDWVSDEKVEIKNIENIQGDEYDIVIFSIGYAKNTIGKMRVQFGSLSQAGGENRLNVAVTRAREKIYIICSFEPEELQIENVSNQGPKILKAYLAYAKNVSQGKFTATPIGDEESFYSSLSKLLQMENNDLSTELPFVDLVGKVGSQYQKAFLTDDNLFFQSLSAKDAFAYTPLTLKAKSWKFERKWSRNYWKGKSAN